MVDGNCDAWNSESEGKRGRGSPLVPGPGGHQARLLGQRSVYDCRNLFVVLCVETTPHSGAMFSRKRRHDEPLTRREYETLVNGDNNGGDYYGDADEDDDGGTIRTWAGR